MTVHEFTDNYKHLITVHFNFDELASNPTITIQETAKTLSDFLEFYIPRYAKMSRWDDRDIDQISRDSDSKIVQLKEIIQDPAEWGLPPFHIADVLSKEVWPIPIATDTLSGKSFVLDSNHTICTLLTSRIDMRVKCVEITGENLGKLGTDLKLMML